MDNQNTTKVTPPNLESDKKYDFSNFDSYYQEEFRKIAESNEQYKGKWNWYSFLFSTLWCFYKGCWAYGLVILISSILTMGTKFYLLVVIGWAVFMGLRGTWLLYTVKIKLKQLPKSLF